MAQRHHHYESAFERYLRSRRIPYVAVDEAKKALLPVDHSFRFEEPGAAPGSSRVGSSLKSFDFVIYGQGGNLLVEVKGRKVAPRPRTARSDKKREGPDACRPVRSRLESWVGIDDVESLKVWQQLFGPEFRAAFVFVYWCEDQPPDGLFQEIFDHNGRWYAVRAVRLDDYARVMRLRSPRWRTVHLPTDAYERISMPLTPAIESLGVAAGSGLSGTHSGRGAGDAVMGGVSMFDPL